MAFELSPSLKINWLTESMSKREKRVGKMDLSENTNDGSQGRGPDKARGSKEQRDILLDRVQGT